MKLLLNELLNREQNKKKRNEIILSVHETLQMSTSDTGD